MEIKRLSDSNNMYINTPASWFAHAQRMRLGMLSRPVVRGVAGVPFIIHDCLESLYCCFASDCLTEVIAGLFVHVRVPSHLALIKCCSSHFQFSSSAAIYPHFWVWISSLPPVSGASGSPNSVGSATAEAMRKEVVYIQHDHKALTFSWKLDRADSLTKEEWIAMIEDQMHAKPTEKQKANWV